MGHRQIRMASVLHSLHSGMWGSLADVMERYQQILAKIKSSRRNKEVNSAPSATLIHVPEESRFFFYHKMNLLSDGHFGPLWDHGLQRRYLFLS